MQNKRDSYNREDLLASSQGELFGPGYPQLPAPNMLMMDRVTKMSETEGTFGKGLILAELDIQPDLWFFDWWKVKSHAVRVKYTKVNHIIRLPPSKVHMGLN